MAYKHIYIDYETFSDVDLKTHGLRRYVESPQFEVLLLAVGRYEEGKRITEVYDLTRYDIPEPIRYELLDPDVVKHAWNAQFERVITEQLFGVHLPVDSWQCTMVHALYCGLPGSLDECGRVLDIAHAKIDGRKLIKKFCTPRKVTKSDSRVRYRSTDPDCTLEWDAFMLYNEYDVMAEMEIAERIEHFPLPQRELELYRLDQAINERGILVDLNFARRADAMHEVYKSEKKAELQELSGLDKVGSVTQIKEWLRQYDIPIPTKLNEATGELMETLDKEAVTTLLTDPTLPDEVRELLEGRQQLGKSSNAKYAAMMATASADSRVRGLLQFYGANRTGRWAGRNVQLHNLPQNHIEHLDAARQLVYSFSGDTSPMELCFGDTPSVLSQLIRTAFIAPDGMLFAVADFSAIEARVTAWLAGEQWRLDVFKTHGKIYEASAARMFNVPLESITKGSAERVKGKIAELAFGFEGGTRAAISFGAEKMGMTQGELATLVSDWRDESPNIVQFWADCQSHALRAINERTGDPVVMHHGITFQTVRNSVGQQWLTIQLPSGRKLFYLDPKRVRGRFGQDTIEYLAADNTKRYMPTQTFGGKICENIVQATARDLLADKLLALDYAGFPIVLHVHDEVVAEVEARVGEQSLQVMCDIMGMEVPWAKGLPLRADGYTTSYYRKD